MYILPSRNIDEATTVTEITPRPLDKSLGTKSNSDRQYRAGTHILPCPDVDEATTVTDLAVMSLDRSLGAWRTSLASMKLICILSVLEAAVMALQ